MRPFAILVMLALLTAVLAGCTHSNGNGDQAAIDTTHGCILIEFFRDEAPQTVDNFIQYAEDGFYEGTIFHRIIQSFMVQGGGFTPDGQQKETRDPIPLEYEVPNERGTMAMARTPDPDSATSQFFINTVDNTESLGPRPGSDGYAVFARVVEGMDVVDAIAATPVQPSPTGEMSQPIDPPVIEAVHVGALCDEVEPEQPFHGVDAGLITNTRNDAGDWETNISAEVDYIPLWVMNTGNQQDTFDLNVEAPDGWEVSLDRDSIDLSPGGSSGDSGAAILTARVEPGTEGPITVRAVSQNDQSASVEFEVQPIFAAEFVDRVSSPGDEVALRYTGSFDNGTVFDSGTIPFQEGGDPAVVAGTGLVTGFAYGLAGIALGETVDLQFPPELGYGYNPPQRLAQFAGEWLNFEITIDQID